ncbi:MAG: nickel-dependent lactate racemase [Candidatus Aminicenantes bacterium]|nr:nickel-dependent lactate racemase [Candidatus Aminicenantes bacterium]
MNIRLAYGRKGLDVKLPETAPVTILEPEFVPGLKDERAALAEALNTPIGCPSLRELVRPSDTVAIVFSDLTRPMPNNRVLPVLLEELNQAGVPDEHVVLVNALGTHRPQTQAELKTMLGEEVVNRYRIVQHNAWDESTLAPVGRNRAGRTVRVNRTYLEASVRILTGFIEPHFFAGFSGGPKAVLPGIADVDSILDNHGAAMLADPRATWTVTESNPLWEEMLEIALLTKPTFLLNVTLNQDRQITGVFAGDLVKAHQAGCAFARRHAIRKVAQPFDIVITSNSGYPLDLNLYQAVKGMSAAARIVKTGGVIIMAAECWDGLPNHGEFKRLLWEASSPEEILARIMTPGFRCHDQWEAQILAQLRQKASIYLYTDGLSEEEIRRSHLLPCRSIEETIQELLLSCPTATIAVLPDGPQTVPTVSS